MPTLTLHFSLPEALVNEIRAILPQNWELHQTIKGQDNSDILSKTDILLGWSSKAKEICLTPGTKLKWVHVWAAGVDNLPLAEFKEHGILLTNSSGVHPIPMSETVLGLMIALTREFHPNIKNQADRLWEQNYRLGELHGKTLGILGTGAIAKETARLAKAFSMTVIGLNTRGTPVKNFDRVYPFNDLLSMASKSDYLVNILPHTPQTEDLINKEIFSAMPQGSYYINIGRGATTDTKALIEALQAGHLAGAGLDVFEKEPLEESSPLWDLDNVIILPHESGLTTEYDRRALDIFLKNLRTYLTAVPSGGETPQSSRENMINVVDLDRGY